MARDIQRVIGAKVLDKEASRIGRELFYGIRRKKNYHRAFPLLLQAANAGYEHSQNLVGYCYSEGLGVKKNLKLALFWFQAAAEEGKHKEALFNLAVAYERGQGTAIDLRKAFACYRQAAKLGDVSAQCNLGVAYLEGLGTRQNLSLGIRWIKRAAQKDDEKAQYNLAQAYRKGEGVGKDQSLARHWFKKAAKNGHKKAAAALRSI